jgi:hypothetical protein
MHRDSIHFLIPPCCVEIVEALEHSVLLRIAGPLDFVPRSNPGI